MRPKPPSATWPLLRGVDEQKAPALPRPSRGPLVNWQARRDGGIPLRTGGVGKNRTLAGVMTVIMIALASVELRWHRAGWVLFSAFAVMNAFIFMRFSRMGIYPSDSGITVMNGWRTSEIGFTSIREFGLARRSSYPLLTSQLGYADLTNGRRLWIGAITRPYREARDLIDYLNSLVNERRSKEAPS